MTSIYSTHCSREHKTIWRICSSASMLDEKLLITLVLCFLKTFIINLSLGDRKGAALHEELRVEMLKWLGRCRHSQYPSRSSSRSSRKICFLGGVASSSFDALVRGVEQGGELSCIGGRTQDLCQGLPPQLVDECRECSLIEFSFVSDEAHVFKAVLGVDVSGDVIFSVGEGVDVSAEAHSVHDAGDALDLQKRTKWRLWTSDGGRWIQAYYFLHYLSSTAFSCAGFFGVDEHLNLVRALDFIGCRGQAGFDCRAAGFDCRA